MRKLFTILLLTISVIAVAQNDAKELLDQVSKKAKSYKNISIKFKHTLENKSAGVHQDALGKVVLQGDLYHFSYMGTEQIYDGKNTYIILHEDEEVMIQPQDMDSETTLTPSKLFSFYEKGYTYKMGAKVRKGRNTIQFVTLLPEDTSSPTKHISIGILLRNKQIKSIEEVGKNGTTTTILVTSFETNQPISKKLFTFDESKYKKDNYTISRPQ
ncbi:MAG: outer membrane lipoprotein carrier protein LolA [Flavobacteriaceae bacterium]|nr:outer membrane lipoprotein carrier protein LolA [Flavobacteriaceae bacterium]